MAVVLIQPRRLPVVLAAAALVLGACSTGGTDQATTAGEVAEEGSELDDSDGATAADTFDPAGLSAAGGGRSRFVPLDDPEMIPADEATWLEPDDVVLGVVWGGEAQAFPVDQMAYHHIANTTVAGEPYLVTY